MSSGAFSDYAAEQEEEIEALQAILMDDIQGESLLSLLWLSAPETGLRRLIGTVCLLRITRRAILLAH